jgi:hypothetical protein
VPSKEQHPGKLKQPPSEGELEALRAALKKAAGNPVARRGMIVHEVRKAMGRGTRVELRCHSYSSRGYVVRVEQGPGGALTAVVDTGSLLVPVPLDDVVEVKPTL